MPLGVCLQLKGIIQAHKLEFLALKWAITGKFHEYLYGAEFQVFTDNNPLTYILTTAKLDATGHRWVAALSNYTFSISYKPGRNNADADALSRIQWPETVDISSQSVHAVCEGVQAPHGQNRNPLPWGSSFGHVITR